MKSKSKTKGKKSEVIKDNQNKDIFQKLNSKYILKKIFDNLEDVKAYEIFRYNKNIQKKLDIDNNSYKELSEIKSSIIIEIIPEKNKYGKIFNYLLDKYESNYHIYFDNDIKEKETNEINEEDKVSKIKLVIDNNIKSLNNLFEDCKCIESINFKRFTRINIDNMRSMFWQCSSLKEINLNKFNTNNVSNMSWMFYRCSELKRIDISNINIDNVESMVGMFWGCSSLEEINLPKFKDDNKINMRCMFSECNDDLKRKVKEQWDKIGFEAFE